MASLSAEFLHDDGRTGGARLPNHVVGVVAFEDGAVGVDDDLVSEVAFDWRCRKKELDNDRSAGRDSRRFFERRAIADDRQSGERSNRPRRSLILDWNQENGALPLAVPLTLWATLSAVDQICKGLRPSQVLGGQIAAPAHSPLSLLLRHGHVAIERGTVLNVQPASLDITV
jgi:hypothetical protein